MDHPEGTSVLFHDINQHIDNDIDNALVLPQRCACEALDWLETLSRTIRDRCRVRLGLRRRIP
jgi:hypothetical protein